MKHLFLLVMLCLLIGKATRGYAQALPIKPTRTIAFTTNVGTHMDVDVSPDGKTLVFDVLGDLYMVPVTGGNATQLTRGMAINLQPIWSPDGKNIVYISDISGALHFNVRNIEGTFRRTLDRSNEQADIYYNFHLPPLFTPDGNYLTIGDTMYGLAGGKIPVPAAIANPLRYSTDGKTVYYLDRSSGICRYDRNKNTKATIFSPSTKLYRNFKNVALSPDARWFAYAVDSNAKRCLIVRDLVNGTGRILVSSLAKYPLGVTPHFAFSPDSKTLYIAYSGRIHKIEVESGADRIIPFKANIKVDLGPFDYNTFRVTHDPLKVRYTRSANASPDGKHLVFSALNKLYVMDLPNGKPHIFALQPVNQFQPVYSPDGKWIAYVSWCDTVGGFLWKVPASGGKPEQLTSVPGHYQRPAWSPDGKMIALVKGGPEGKYAKLYAAGKGIPKLGDGYIDYGIGQLELIPTEGGEIRAVVDSASLWSQLAFSPDGQRVIYQPYGVSQNSSFQPLLVSKKLNGSDPKVIAAGKILSITYPGDIQQRTVSPSGRYLVYSLNEDLYLVPLNKIIDTTDIYDDTQKLQIIRFATGVDPHWEQGGRILSWSYGNKFYRVNPDKIMATAEKAAQKNQANNIPEKDILTAWTLPDQVIDLNVTVPTHYAHGTIAFKNARIITMQGSRVIEHGTILIKDGRFSALGSNSAIAIPKGAKVIDLSGKTIMPGFVDLHLHFRDGTNISPQQNWSFLINLAYGVTTARDPSTSYDSFGYAELLQSGQMLGPRLYSSGVAVTDEIRVGNMDDARFVVDKRKALGGTFMKQYMLNTRIQREWLLMASKEAGMNLTNEGEYSIARDIGMLKDGDPGIEHNPDWGDVYKDVTTLFAKSGTYFTPTLQVRVDGLQYFDQKYWQHPDSKLTHFMTADQLNNVLRAKPRDTTNSALFHAAQVYAQIRKQGGLVTLGSHGNNEGIGVHNELWALQMGGLTNMQTLQAATIMGAKAIGIQKDVGSIEVGKIADLIILNKNPLDDIHNSREIKYVMKDGILYNADTLDEIWPVAKKCPEWKLKNDTTTNEQPIKPKNLHQNSEDDE